MIAKDPVVIVHRNGHEIVVSYSEYYEAAQHAGDRAANFAHDTGRFAELRRMGIQNWRKELVLQNRGSRQSLPHAE